MSYLSNDAEYAKFITQADKDRMKPELRHKMYQDVSSKNAVINKYLKKIAALAEIDKPLSMHISRHSFAHIARNPVPKAEPSRTSSATATSLPPRSIWAVFEC